MLTLHVQVDKKRADKNCKKRWGYLGITVKAFKITSATVSPPPPPTSLPSRQVGALRATFGWGHGWACREWLAGLTRRSCPMAGSSGGLAKGGGGDLRGLKLEEETGCESVRNNMKQNKKIKKLILMHWAEVQLVVSRMFVVIVVVGLVSLVLVSSASSIVVAIVLAAIILVVAAVGGGGGDLYATLVLRVATAWRRGGRGFRAGWRWTPKISGSTQLFEGKVATHHLREVRAVSFEEEQGKK
ncbi:hypothetical protein EDB85DRAFT_2204852 [Lactarius pseudohatsudake]|nr:hypothetical protein EDB85DRAFT_2204852 [Lactarius pseudohatsudake]